MTFWLVYTSALILVAFGAMISEGVESIYAAKIAGYALLAAIFGFGVLPNLYLNVGDITQASVSGLSANNASKMPAVGQSMRDPGEIQYRYVGGELQVATEDGFVGVDMTPTCGGKAGVKSVKVEIAQAAKGRADQAVSAHRC